MSSLADLGIGLVVIVALGFLCIAAVRPTRRLAGGRTIRTKARAPSSLRLYALDPAAWVKGLLVALSLASLGSDLAISSDLGRLWVLFAALGAAVAALPGETESIIGAGAALIGVVVVVIGQMPWSPVRCPPPPGTVPGWVVGLLVIVPLLGALVVARLVYRRSVARGLLGLQAFALVDLARLLALPGGVSILPVVGGAPTVAVIGIGSALYCALMVASPGLALVLGAVMVGLTQLLFETAYPERGCSAAPAYGALLATAAAFLGYLIVAGLRERSTRR